jgi:hypothetical protein
MPVYGESFILIGVKAHQYIFICATILLHNNDLDIYIRPTWAEKTRILKFRIIGYVHFRREKRKIHELILYLVCQWEQAME